ncbi:phosphatase PAP2 family protein [Paraburkholderia phytofirmans]|jgi:membrane-associated phospholipid phosphatase|uniref:Phosphoesterase n=1 Tax=Paraburkholderia phytofirmans OLGA172 TaxID=1417228 RepID=A0A160FHC5_9BURK|nr:phosphatase PAP2 family protein [Paraburkholderia phytofirmans]ANB71532.1 phosphoesterase [Paraburkholderia phytofirmans OLGA172]
MNGFDLTILTFLTHGAFSTPFVNSAIKAIAGMYTFKGLLLVPILWWIWFRPTQRGEWEREIVIATFVSGLVALVLGRLLAHYLPFRVRPIYNPDLHLQFPVAEGEHELRFWSSFPSDHAMVWMSVAMGIFLVSYRVGIPAILYTAIFICATRIYLGLHYPTDVIAGLLIGVVVTYVMTRDSIRKPLAAPFLRWIHRWPGLCYAMAFVLCFELATQFDEVRMLVHAVSKVVAHS